MIKSVTFISMIVTTFVLVLLAGVVYAYQGFAASAPTPTLQSTFNPQTVDLSLNPQSQTNSTDISPQEAASTAVKFSNRTDLYSVELADFNGSQTYKVTFSSGDTIYVSFNGQVVGSAPPPQSQSVVASPTTLSTPAVIYQGPIKKRPTAGHGGSSSSSNGGGGGGGGHEGGGD
jgi:uncharacterized membrane protein YgcG